MPVHDWTLVDAGVFHDFHQSWIISLRNSLNSGLLPNDFYAMAEQVAEGPIPDVVTLERISQESGELGVGLARVPISPDVGMAVLDAPPKTRFNHEADASLYAARSTQVVVRHVSGDRIVGFIEIVSPGNKHSAVAFRNFVEKLGAAIQAGCHLLVIDLHPPTPRDPRGVHAKFWEDSYGITSAPGVEPENPLGMAAYVSAMRPVAYFEPFAVGSTLIDMPIFLSQDRYINVPLERTYMEAWQGVPRRWREVVDRPKLGT